MAELILFHFAEDILSKLSSNAVQQIGLAWGVKKELRKLKETISTIRNVLLDAQEQQMKNRTVKEWLRRLKYVIYDADDLLDDVTTEALRRQVETHTSKVKEVRDFFTGSNPILFRYAVGRKIKDIRESLDEIVSEMRDFQLVLKHVEKPIEIQRREETSSFVCVPEVIGRESGRECLINMLLSSGNEENARIIPIVGMGGIGKTTLAQLVYKDDRIQHHFIKKMWVCVSVDFDVKRILVKVLQAVGDNSCSHQGIEQVKNRAQEVLRDNKFFLVLDDVWNENTVKWTELQDLLIMGARGSRIVVTTRNKMVASIVHTSNVEPYELKGLSDKQCSSILLRCAFEKGEENKHKDLVNIGMEIVKKCGGVPLAARTLGALLFSKTNARDWSSVRDSELWTFVQNENDILPILKLSYDQMPSYLKQCFGYCSLFGKAKRIKKRKLMYGWMAHGFLQSSNKNDELEDIGDYYILELVRRSFLQPETRYVYKMHDLVHDLAQYVAGNEYMTIKEFHAEAIPDSVRHVSFDSSTYCEFPTPLTEHKKLRTVFLPKNTGLKFGSPVELAISSLKCLRVLEAHSGDLSYGWRMDSLPKNVGTSKHLRFLSFPTEQELPSSVCKLLNLQYLDLGGSKFSELPRDFGNLVNLRFLCLSSKLTCLPEKGIGGLSSLQTLILVRNHELRSLGEGIQHLTSLRFLEITDASNLGSLPAGFRHLTSLEDLVISSCDNLEFSDDDFKGLRSLKTLELVYLPRLVILPKGLQEAAALTRLQISVCLEMTFLSDSVLPKLQSLQSLIISYCPNVSSLPEGMQCLTELHSLSIKECPRLTRRCEEGVGEDWPKIAHIPKIKFDAKVILKE